MLINKKEDKILFAVFILGFALSALVFSLPILAQVHLPDIEPVTEMGKAMTLEEWEKQVHTKEQVRRKQAILGAQKDIAEKTFRFQWESFRTRSQDLIAIDRLVQLSRNRVSTASPRRFSGKNDDGTVYMQFTGKGIQVLKKFLQERGESLPDGLSANGDLGWSVTYNQKDKDKFGTIFTNIRTIQVDDKGDLPVYIESDNLTPVYDSETGEVYWQKVTTITDNIEWIDNAKYYANNKTEARRSMTAYHQKTSNHELNSTTEIWRDNIEYSDVADSHMPVSFHQKVSEVTLDEDTGEMVKRISEMERYDMEYIWSPGEKDGEGQWLLTKYSQKLYNNSQAPGLTTYSEGRLTYDEFDRTKTSLTIEHQMGEFMDSINIIAETDMNYDPKLGLYLEDSLNADISPSNFGTVEEALDYGKKLLLVMSDKDLRKGVEERLGEEINFSNIDHLDEYDRWISLIMDKVMGGKTIPEAVQEAKGLMSTLSPKLIKAVEEWKGKALDLSNDDDLKTIQDWKEMNERGWIRPEDASRMVDFEKL